MKSPSNPGNSCPPGTRATAVSAGGWSADALSLTARAYRAAEGRAGESVGPSSPPATTVAGSRAKQDRIRSAGRVAKLADARDLKSRGDHISVRVRFPPRPLRQSSSTGHFPRPAGQTASLPHSERNSWQVAHLPHSAGEWPCLARPPLAISPGLVSPTAGVVSGILHAISFEYSALSHRRLPAGSRMAALAGRAGLHAAAPAPAVAPHTRPCHSGRQLRA